MADLSIEWLSRSYHEEAALRAEELHSSEECSKGSRSQVFPNSPNNTSGSESEEEAARQRRMRTKFTSEQIGKLESTFRKHRYLGSTQRRKFAEKLKLSETQVKTWFQNRRMKLKRELQDLRPDFLCLPAALLFQHHAPSGQLRALSGFSPELQPLHRTPRPAPTARQAPLLPVFLPPHLY